MRELGVIIMSQLSPQAINHDRKTWCKLVIIVHIRTQAVMLTILIYIFITYTSPTSADRPGTRRGQPIGGKKTNLNVYSSGPCTCPYIELGICRAHGGGCGQGPPN